MPQLRAAQLVPLVPLLAAAAAALLLAPSAAAAAGPDFTKDGECAWSASNSVLQLPDSAGCGSSCTLDGASARGAVHARMHTPHQRQASIHTPHKHARTLRPTSTHMPHGRVPATCAVVLHLPTPPAGDPGCPEGHYPLVLFFSGFQARKQLWQRWRTH